MPNELTTRSERIAAEIRAEMARQMISNNALADEIGMPISTLRRSVNGDRPFNLDEFWAVAQALDLSATELVARSQDKVA